MIWNVRKLISPPFQRISITNRVLSFFDCFTTYYNCMTCQNWNFKNFHISANSVHKNHKSCFYLIWPFYDWNVIKLISPPFQCTSITNRVLSLFDRFTTYCNCITWNGRKLISFPFQRISITNRVLNLFDCFTTYYNCMTWNFKKLISPPFQFTSITNRLFTLFDRFTTSYDCMTWNVRKLISPPFQCTSITNRVLRLFDRFTTYYNPKT